MKKLIFCLLFIITSFSLKAQSICGPFTNTAPFAVTGMNNHKWVGLHITGAGSFAIHLFSCHNDTIMYCDFGSTTATPAIRLDGCSNIVVIMNHFNGVAGAFYATNCTGGIKFIYNQVENMVGIATLSHAAQLNTCSGGGNSTSYNLINTPIGSGSNPNPLIGDILNIYKSDGIVSDPILIRGNKIYGGGTAVGSKGNAGIVFGDQGGTYQVCDSNYLVNCGYVGIQRQGGSIGFICQDNYVYSRYFPWSRVGVADVNSSVPPVASSGNINRRNHIKWIAGYNGTGYFPYPGVEVDTLHKYGTGGNTNPLPIGWTTNITHAAIDSTIAYPPLWTSCLLAPSIFYTLNVQVGTYGTPIIPMSLTNTGGSITSLSISPALPSGLNFNTTTGLISGTPTAPHALTNYTVTATNATGSGTAPVTITIQKAALTITAVNERKIQGRPNPTLTAAYSGFIPGEDHTVLTAQPVLSTTAVTGSPVGIYPISVCCATATNYNITYVFGVLIVHPRGIGIKGPRIIINKTN